jgi:uncharacterized membrane protein
LELNKKELTSYYNSLEPFWYFIPKYFKSIKNKLTKNKESKDKEANKIKKYSARVVLWFEKTVSNFGTLIWNPIFWWFICLIFFALLILWAYSNFSFDTCSSLFIFKYHQENFDILSYAFSPISFLLDSKFLKKDITWWFLIMFFNFLKTIFLSILTYEVIKSFRKFSRKL